MTYDCYPYWQKAKVDDPFDYQLRSKEEVYYQMFIKPPIFNIQVEKHIPYIYLDEKPTANSNFYNKVRLVVYFDDLNLYPYQLERFIFLIGDRYKGDYKFKLNVSVSKDIEVNMGYGLDIIKQLYYEALRAPLRFDNAMKKKVASLNMSIEEEEKSNKEIDFLENKETKQYQIFKPIYDKMNDKSLSQEERDIIKKELFMINAQSSIEEDEEKEEKEEGKDLGDENSIKESVEKESDEKEKPSIEEEENEKRIKEEKAYNEILEKIDKKKEVIDRKIETGKLT
eukprot:CAMPEP_0170521458 /NCGR_PEP_ID=MMETSP0209-20121228/6817_1 /TAXON_ID=665100 ORGANISM="Litonotus pictus, Strain P1" /NCGR_SAMPLE_ID=MMETSP0209 /ASSEMBLY_ACC=CAM_ASM_000301 /LENGTH=282 /DNA_ID=CAMNT_0010808335 /DNA_START=87 /DNA_END=932 /DNA_ORIENTATION=-